MNIDTNVYRKHESPTFGNTLLGAVPFLNEIVNMDWNTAIKQVCDKSIENSVKATTK